MKLDFTVQEEVTLQTYQVLMLQVVHVLLVPIVHKDPVHQSNVWQELSQILNNNPIVHSVLLVITVYKAALLLSSVLKVRQNLHT